MQRVKSVSCFGAALGSLALAASSRAAVPGETPARPNIVFIMADDLGYADVGCFGSTYYKTPNIDALAKRGMIFTQAYTANATCSPTRASIMSGQYPARLGMMMPTCHLPEVRMEAEVTRAGKPTAKCLDVLSVSRLDTNVVTLAEVLKEAGYATGHFGKWHLGPVPFSPLEQGFDVDVPHTPSPGLPRGYLAPWGFPNLQGEPGEQIEVRMAAEAGKFIRENREKKFFMTYWAFSPHSMYNAEAALVEKYRAQMNPANPQHNPVYAAIIERLDDAVGMLVKELESAGVMNKTLIIFFSDNGGINWPMQVLKDYADALAKTYADIPISSNVPFRGGKAMIYEGGTRVPCFFVWPEGIRPGTRTDAMIQSMDFYPTLAAVAEAKLPEQQPMDGRNFLPVLQGKVQSFRDEIFGFLPNNIAHTKNIPAASVRQGDWKLIRFLHDGPAQAHRYELYNLREDPSEAKDLSASFPERVAALDARITWFLKDTGAVVPGPNPAYKGE